MVWNKFNINELSADDYNRWFSLASLEKQKKINRFRLEKDKKRSVAGEMLVKKNISEILKIPPESIKISTEKGGKPYIENLAIHFNLSHSGDWVVCALHNKPIGIDIEKITPINLKIAKRFFTQEEQFYIFNKSPEENDFTATPTNEILKRFFEIWTAKEAYLKFTGEGLCEKLNELNINRKNINVYYFDDYIVSIYIEK